MRTLHQLSGLFGGVWRGLPGAARVGFILLFLVRVPMATAQQFVYDYAMDFVTENAATYFQNHEGGCFAPTCVFLPSPGDGTWQASTSDWAVGQAIWIYHVADGEQISWAVTDPKGNQLPPFTTLVWNQSSGCFLDYVNGQLTGQWCTTQWPFGFAAWFTVNSCYQTASPYETGLWSLSTYDNGSIISANGVPFTNPFQVVEMPAGCWG